MNRPDSFGYAMDFLGDPEASELLAYIQELEKTQGEWIEVDDVLPKEGVMVLAYNPWFVDPLAVTIQLLRHGKWYCQKEWNDAAFIGTDDVPALWQPMPSLPTDK